VTEPQIDKLAIAVTFFYVEDRLRYLKRIAEEFPRLTREIVLTIITNRPDETAHAAIADAVGGIGHEVVVPSLLGHPYLLTWTHFLTFRRLIAEDPSITHFLYVEDDILIQPHNIAYWLKGREALRGTSLYPSFLRYEMREGDPLLYSTDLTVTGAFDSLPKVPVGAGYAYVNLSMPYQGTYLCDREQMSEHLEGTSSNPDYGNPAWGIRERATQGLTFHEVPRGFTSRNLVGYKLDAGEIDPDCMVHHLPNNYTNRSRGIFGMTLVRDLILPPGTVAPAKAGKSAAKGQRRRVKKTAGRKKVTPPARRSILRRIARRLFGR
jgi:hypothetical protein